MNPHLLNSFIHKFIFALLLLLLKIAKNVIYFHDLVYHTGDPIYRGTLHSPAEFANTIYAITSSVNRVHQKKNRRNDENGTPYYPAKKFRIINILFRPAVLFYLKGVFVFSFYYFVWDRVCDGISR